LEPEGGSQAFGEELATQVSSTVALRLSEGGRFPPVSAGMLDSQFMRHVFWTWLAMVPMSIGCGVLPNGSSMDHAQAQRLSDAYMANLIADRVDLAVDKMELTNPQDAQGRAKTEELIRGLFSYCGRPLESELRHEETGFFLYADGRKAPMRAFFYSGKTTQFSKGVCFFAVRVVPGQGGMRVVNFGPLKLISGQLPEWAR